MDFYFSRQEHYSSSCIIWIQFRVHAGCVHYPALSNGLSHAQSMVGIWRTLSELSTFEDRKAHDRGLKYPMQMYLRGVPGILKILCKRDHLIISNCHDDAQIESLRLDWTEWVEMIKWSLFSGWDSFYRRNKVIWTVINRGALINSEHWQGVINEARCVKWIN